MGLGVSVRLGYRRTRYDTIACGSQRIDAGAVEDDAAVGALVGFYRYQHALIAITAAQTDHAPLTTLGAPSGPRPSGPRA